MHQEVGQVFSTFYKIVLVCNVLVLIRNGERFKHGQLVSEKLVCAENILF